MQSILAGLQKLEEVHSDCKKKRATGGDCCLHGFLDYRAPSFFCADCCKEINEAEYPELYLQEVTRLGAMELKEEEKEADTMDRGVTIGFLVAFCETFDLWDRSVDDVRRNFIVPMTCETRGRFVDLPVLRASETIDVVGPAETYISCTRANPFSAIWWRRFLPTTPIRIDEFGWTSLPADNGRVRRPTFSSSMRFSIVLLSWSFVRIRNRW